MRFLILFILFVSISCKQNKQETKIKKKPSTEVKVDTIPLDIKISICEKSKRDIRLYKDFIDKEKIVYKDSMKGNRLYYKSEKKHFDKLFNSKNINCIVPLSGGEGYNIFDIYYDTIIAEDIFNNIVGINKKRDNEELNNYHDFFKRGMIFSLNKKDNKITVITFNPFIDNSMPKKIKSYFSKTNFKYDRVIMTTGLGYLEVLIE